MDKFKRAQWKTLFALILCYSFYYCGRQNFGFAIVGIQQSLHLTTTDTGLISAGLLLSYGVGQAINGSLGDKYGARKLVTLGAFLSVIFNFIASFAIGFWSLFIPSCLIGYSQSLGFAPGSKLITDWWEKKERGNIFGIYLASSGISSIIVYALCLAILNYFDWHWIFRLPVLLLMLSSVLFYLMVRDKPSELGFPDIQSESQQDILNLSAYKRYRMVVTNFRFQMASIAMGCCSIARYGLIVWIPMIFMGADNHQVWKIVALPLGMALGSIVEGKLSDKFFATDRIKPAILFLLMATFSTIALYYIQAYQSNLAMVLLFLSGLFVFGPQTSLFALCPELVGSAASSTAVGIMNAYGYAFSAAGEVLIGFLIHKTQHTTITFAIVAAACALGVIAAYFAANSRHPGEGRDPRRPMPLFNVGPGLRRDDGNF